MIDNNVDFKKFLELREDVIVLVYVADKSRVDVFAKYYPDIQGLALKPVPQEKS